MEIRRVRADVLHWDQGKFAKSIGVTQSLVSKWERGAKEPSSALYKKIADLVPPVEGGYFLQRAISRHGLEAVMEELRPRNTPLSTIMVQPARGATVKGSGEMKAPPDAIAIPLLRDAAAAGSPRLIEQAAVDDTIVMTRKSCPHPKDTVCLKIMGDSMAPLLDDGYIVAIDTADRDHRRLEGHMIAARDPEGGVTVKWLRRLGGKLALIPQHTSLRHQIMVMEEGWGIVGRVIWFIGTPPAPEHLAKK